MRPRWEDVNARARGLGTRLLAPDALASLSQIQGIGVLSRALAARGVIPEENAAGDAMELGLALRLETLPLSLANAYLPPAWLSPEMVCTLPV